MEFVLKTRRIRKKTKHWREAVHIRNMEKKFMPSERLGMNAQFGPEKRIVRGMKNEELDEESGIFEV